MALDNQIQNRVAGSIVIVGMGLITAWHGTILRDWREALKSNLDPRAEGLTRPSVFRWFISILALFLVFDWIF